MSIWKKALSKDMLHLFNTQVAKTNMVGHIGLQYTAFGPNWLEATMPVDERTIQPFGILHGGASCVMAETLGSYASVLASGDDKTVVGVDINATHLRSVKAGSSVTGRATALKIGNRLHIWEIKMHETGKEEDGLTCISRLSVMVIDKKSNLHKPSATAAAAAAAGTEGKK